MGIDLREFSGSRFIKLADVEQHPIRATIVAVEKGKWDKLNLLLSTGDKFSLNKQNCRTLSRAYGNNGDDLLGQEIELAKGELDTQDGKTLGVVAHPISPPNDPEAVEAAAKDQTKPKADYDDDIPY
jgi:hypothetical protein